MFSTGEYDLSSLRRLSLSLGEEEEYPLFGNTEVVTDGSKEDGKYGGEKEEVYRISKEYMVYSRIEYLEEGG